MQILFYTLSSSVLWITQDYRFCSVLSVFFLSRRFNYISGNDENEGDDEDAVNDDDDDNNRF